VYQAGIALEKEDIYNRGLIKIKTDGAQWQKIPYQDLSNHFLAFFKNLWDDCLHTSSLVKTNQGG
jgi:hypothetical protein